MPTIAIGSAAGGRALRSRCSSSCRWAGESLASRCARSLIRCSKVSARNAIAAEFGGKLSVELVQTALHSTPPRKCGPVREAAINEA